MALPQIRNVGIVAHIDAGKTTTTERILFYSGHNYKIGEVDQGAATMDWMPQEQERGITITAAATTCFWEKDQERYQLNIIDTPGHVDFTIEVERSLRVLDGVVVVICGVAGIQPQTMTVWKQANKFNVPRLVLINKLDRRGAQFYKHLEDLNKTFDCNAVALTIPVGLEENFSAVINVLEEKLYTFPEEDYGKSYTTGPVPKEMLAEVATQRAKILEAASVFDDKLLEILLNEGEIPVDLVISALKKGVLAHKIQLVYAGSAFRNKGVQNVLDGVVDFLPNPIEAEAVIAKDLEGESHEIKSLVDGPILALLYKVQIDSYSGLLSYIRVYSGQINTSKAYWNASRQKRERIQKLFRVYSSKKEEIDFIQAGDIAAVTGLSDSQTGDTFTEKDSPLLLEPIFIPQPVIEIALELRANDDSAQLNTYLGRLLREDPSLKLHTDKETGQLILAGMGELHLEVALDRIMREAGVKVNAGKPKVAIRETISLPAKGSEFYEKPVMGKPSFAEVNLEIKPTKGDGKNIIKISADLGARRELSSLIEAGINESLQSGVLAGNQVINVAIDVTSVKIDESNFVPEAFRIAANIALRKALLAAGAVSLTPFMEVKTLVPEEFLGSAINDLNQRTAKILAVEDSNDDKLIVSNASLKKLIGYMTDLRSLTQGRGTYSMEFSHFE